MTITGIKVQANTASVSNNGASTPPATGGPNTSPAPALKQRAAAFNGSLGFYTLGLSIEVLGEFALQRWVAQRGVNAGNIGHRPGAAAEKACTDGHPARPLLGAFRKNTRSLQSASSHGPHLPDEPW